MIIIVKYETIPKIHIKVTVHLALNQTDHFSTKSCVTREQSWIIMETHNSTHTDQFPYLFFYLLIHLSPPSLHPNSPFPYLAPSHYCYVRRMKCNQRPKWVPHVLLRSVFIESFSRSVCFHELLYLFISLKIITLWCIITIKNIIPLLCTVWVRRNKISRIAECLSTVYRSHFMRLDNSKFTGEVNWNYLKYNNLVSKRLKHTFSKLLKWVVAAEYPSKWW